MPSFNRDEYNKKIIARAIKDPNFRSELKKNPKAVIERELGITCPSDISVEVMEQPANKWYIVVPIISSTDLSEGELKDIAGGFWGDSKGRCTYVPFACG